MVDTTKVILAKKEAVYGTDVLPTAAANAVLTRNFSAEPIVTDVLERPLDLPSRGRRRTKNTNKRTTFGYELELAGSGEAGTAPGWMEHLEACGMAAPALTADTSAEQKFAGAGVAVSSLTCHHWMGDQRVRARGARGSFSLDFTAGAVPFARFDMTGLLPAPPAPPVDNVAPVGEPDFDRWIEPLEVHTDNTEFTLDGYALILRSFTLDAGAQVNIRNLVGANYVNRGNHAATGRIVGQAPTIAAKNYYLTLAEGDEVPVGLIHGTEDGNIVELAGDYLQITKIVRTEEDDVLMLDITYGLNIRAGSDDLVLIAR